MQKSEHPYCAVNMNRQPDEMVYDIVQIPWGKQQQYTICKKIGRGKYSHVFEGNDTKTKKKVVIKVLLPIRKSKIKRQYHILKTLNHPNIIKLVDVVKCSHMKTASFIFEKYEHQDFRELYPKLTLSDIRLYMKQLLEGLDYLHGQGIMHRDIKPYNVLINDEKKDLKIIDLGLSEYYFPTKENNTRVASLYYKAPELFFENTQYDYRVDCWAAGMIFAGMIFKKTPFLIGNDVVDQILKVCKLLGTKEVVSYIKEYRLTEKRNHKKENICFDILVAFENGDIASEKSSTFEEFINEGNQANATWEAIDLIKHLLVLDFVIDKQFLEATIYSSVGTFTLFL